MRTLLRRTSILLSWVAASGVATFLGCQLIAGIGDIELALPEGGVVVDGGITCSGGLTLCGATCVDLLTDPHNCRACGRDCLGGSCWAASCQPTVLVSDPKASTIAVDETNVYWWHGSEWSIEDLDASSLMKCNKEACDAQVTALATNREPGLVIALDDASVFWPERTGGRVLKCNIAGCTNQPTVVVNGPQAPYPISLGAFSGIALDSTTAYWASSEYGWVYKCSKDGAAPAALGGGWGPTSLVVDSTNVYWLDEVDGKVLACNKVAGCNTPTQLGVTSIWGGAQSLVVDSTSLYWLDLGDGGPNAAVLKCAVGGCGQQPTPLAKGLARPYALARYETDLYWGDSTGALWTCKTTGCNGQPVALASQQGWIGSIAVDATAIYWLNNQGIMRLVK